MYELTHIRIDAISPMAPAFFANTVAVPDIPSRRLCESTLAGIEMAAGNTEVPPMALVRASVPDTAIAD